MAHIKFQLFTIVISLVFLSCENLLIEEDPENTPVSNFETLWKQLDEKYTYFVLKNVDWNAVYDEYRPLIRNDMSSNELWNVCSEMLCKLRDDHTNLFYNNNWSSWLDCEGVEFKDNFDFNIILKNYLDNPVKTSGPLMYTVIDNTGYIYYKSFTNTIADGDIDFLISHFKDTDGLIIDVRSNTGGNSANADKIISRLLTTRTLVELLYHKNGPGHNDFTQPQKLYISPEGSNHYTKPIVVLIDRASFSSTSFFASRISVLPHVTLVGDTTSGGAGNPKFFDLPNGWGVRYSSNSAVRPDGYNFENGVPPDHYLEMKRSDLNKGRDTYIEFAISLIKDNQ